MNSQRFSSFVVSLGVFLLPSLLSLQGQDAKTYWARVNDPHERRCDAPVDACKAHQLDPKNKEYESICNTITKTTVESDRLKMDQAHAAFDSGEPSKLQTAQRNAKAVCSTSTDEFADAQNLMKDIETKIATVDHPPQPPPLPVDQGIALTAQAESYFANGQLDQAMATANSVPDQSSSKPHAQAVVNRINQYRAYIAEGRSADVRNDYATAKQDYDNARNLAPNGPVDLTQLIASDDDKLRPKPPPPIGDGGDHGGGGHPPPPQPPDPRLAAARMVEEAQRVEKSQKKDHLQEALRMYRQAQRTDAANTIASDGVMRVQSAINRDPQAQAVVLATAIRDFYSYQYDDAGFQLESYLSSPTAKYRGAALFYQGATFLHKALLESSNSKNATAIRSQAVQTSMKAARSAGYKPLDRFLSPAMKCAWEISGGSSACSI